MKIKALVLLQDGMKSNVRLPAAAAAAAILSFFVRSHFLDRGGEWWLQVKAHIYCARRRTSTEEMCLDPDQPPSSGRQRPSTCTVNMGLKF